MKILCAPSLRAKVERKGNVHLGKNRTHVQPWGTDPLNSHEQRGSEFTPEKWRGVKYQIVCCVVLGRGAGIFLFFLYCICQKSMIDYRVVCSALGRGHP